MSTMIYTHVLNRGPGAIRSPADTLLATPAGRNTMDDPPILLPRYTATRSSMRRPRLIARQAAQPSGILGRAIAWVMEWKTAANNQAAAKQSTDAARYARVAM